MPAASAISKHAPAFVPLPPDVLQRHAARSNAVERLELLDRIAFDAGADTVAHDREEIDEELGAQQIVDFVLARRVAAHQALQRGRLVGREVVDVQVGIGLRAAPSRSRRSARKPPSPPAGWKPSRRRSVACRRRRMKTIAEQKFEAAVADERIAFEVEEDVARRRFGKARQAEARRSAAALRR